MKNLIHPLCFLLAGFALNLNAMAQDNGEPASERARGEKEEEVEIATLEESVFLVVEEMPEFPGGNAKMMQFISDNIVYPKKAKRKKIEGRVIAQFIVDMEGNLKDIKIIRGIGYGCDKEVIRVLKKMPQWKPGKQRGKPVQVRYNLPVVFKLG